MTLDRSLQLGYDATVFHATALAADLDAVLALEAERLTAGCRGIDSATFERGRAVAAEQRAEAPVDELDQALRANVFGTSHPYLRSILGADLDALTLDDVWSFVAAHYTPDRAILVIGGRFDPDAVVRQVARRFGALDRRAVGPRAVIPPLAWPIRGESELYLGTRPQVVIASPTAPWGTPEAIDDDLLDELLKILLVSPQPWIVDARVGHLYGVPRGVRYIAVTVTDPQWFDNAIEHVFGLVRSVDDDDADRQNPRRVSGQSLVVGSLVTGRLHRTLESIVSLDSRGVQCGNALQHAEDRDCGARDLRILQEDRVAHLRARARLLTRANSYVVRVLPRDDAGGSEPAIPHSPAAQIDAPVWRPAADPAEASRAIDLPFEPPRTRLSTFRLDNGLQVVMAPGYAQPLIDVRLVFPIDDPAAAGHRSLANAAAHLLRPTLRGRYSPEDQAAVDFVLWLGAITNVDVGVGTAFRVHGASAAPGWMVWRMSWLLERGHYIPQELVRWSRPAFASSSLRYEALFGAGHPFAADRDPTLRVDDLERFRASYYRAAGATLIIAGNFDPAAMRRTVTELFGAWSGEPPPRIAALPAMRPSAGPTWIVRANPKAAQIRVVIDFAARSARVAARAARLVAERMIRRRLDVIRAQMGASAGISVGYLATPGGDLFEIEGLVDAARAGQVVRRIQAELDGLHADDRALAGDFVRARHAQLAAALADPAHPVATAERLQWAVTVGAPLDADDALPGAIARTTLADVRRMIDEDLAPAHMVGELSGRPADTAATVTAAGITAARVIEDPRH